MSPASKNPFAPRAPLKSGDPEFQIFHLDALERAGIGRVSRLPFSLKILLENLLRFEDGRFVQPDDVRALATWNPAVTSTNEVSFMPARVLLQDFTGVPTIVDMAAMRKAMRNLGGDPKKINPPPPADLVIDHSVQVDQFGTSGALAFNALVEFQRNLERYAFLRWGQKAFQNFKVVPPETGICHQVNLEYLAQVVFRRKSVDESGASSGKMQAFPDSLVGTDSHTTMVNGLGVFGWG